MNPNIVACHWQQKRSYCNEAPFDAPCSYPEYPFAGRESPSNEAYQSVRECLHLLGLNNDRYGYPDWNPLGELIHSGDLVLLKPNMISGGQADTGEWQHVITHGSLIRAVLDYAYIALRGQGRIVIADAPQEDSNIDEIKARAGIEALQQLYWTDKRFEIEFMDLRERCLIVRDGIYHSEVKLRGDGQESVCFDLGKDSLFEEHAGGGKMYYGADYDIEETNRHHHAGVHEYLLSRTPLDCDVFISIPKLKTHKKVGVTINLKGLVGINARKNWLPHYAIGSSRDNGDQFQSPGMRGWLENRLVLTAKRFLLKGDPLFARCAGLAKRCGYIVFGDTKHVVRSGNWYGNDTCWRMVLDLNRILLYGRPDGRLGPNRRRYFSVVDGIIGMEGNGPLDGKRREVGLVTAGCDPVAVDVVCATLMGFDYRKIKMIFRAFDKEKFPICQCSIPEIVAVSNRGAARADIATLGRSRQLGFEPHFGWVGQVEILP